MNEQVERKGFELVQFITARVLIYALLTFFAIVMLFPFIYMMMTSLKTSDDVFHAPPRLLPYSPVTREIDGQAVPLYLFEIEGEEREMIQTDEKEAFGFFTTADLINVDTPRESEVVVQEAIANVTATDKTQTLTKSDGSEAEFEVFTVTVGGDPIEMLLAYRSNLDKFISPDDPTVTAYGVARTARAVEEVEFQVENYNLILGRAPEEDPDAPAVTGNLRLDLRPALINTTLVTILVCGGQLVTSIFGGYAFSRIQFKGRDTLFVAYLGSIMIPFVVLIIPIYRLMVIIGWEGRIASLIIPWIFTAYGTFLMRQFFITIPKEIEEAALLDGCSRFRILWTIFVPLSTPAVATLGIFSFLYAWNSFLWPLLIIGEGNEPNHVLTLSLIRLGNIAADKPNLMLTGAAVAIIPPILVFILAQRYFIEGVTSSAVKG
jgi:multiple sugar transport system permease protein